jgi:hypothetical protein
MSLEKAIADLTVAIQENTAALKAGGGKAAASSGGETTANTKPKGETKPSSKHTRAEMQAALSELKEKKGTEAARTVIKDVGGAGKMAEIPEDKIDAVYDAAKKALEDAGEEM